MGKHQGITTKILKDGSKNIMVRFKHLSKTYPVKNFTKLFGCQTETKAFEILQKVKIAISEGKDPFVTTFDDLNSLFDKKLEEYKAKGKWSYHTCRNNYYFYNKHIRNKIGHKKIEKIKYEDINNILDTFEKNQDSSKNYVISLLNPIFKEELKKGKIHSNEIDKIDKVKTPVRERIELRSSMKEIDIIKELYNNIENYNFRTNVDINQIKTFFYLTIMTAHRWGRNITIKKRRLLLG